MTSEKTTIDWLRFRTKAEPRDILEAVRPMYGSAADSLGLKPLERGMLGFKKAAQIVLEDVPVARIDFGGESQRGWSRVDISGSGCQWVQDWEAARFVQELPQAQIKRLDIALTTWEGEVTHDLVVEAHSAGRFVLSGRPPMLTQIIKSEETSGRTCYIGQREGSDKFMRCYEKGYEMLAKLGPRRVVSAITHLDGFKVDDIYRCEVEFKSVTKDISWDVIPRRDEYFAGAYPFCADILPNVRPDKLKKRPDREAQISLDAALENCRIQFGPTILTALHAYHGDITSVWEKIIGEHHNQSLLEAGVLLVEHN